MPGFGKVFARRNGIASSLLVIQSLGGDMKKNLAALAVPLLFSLSIAAGPVLADDHGKGLFIDHDVDTFAVLPQGVRLPEGIAANPANGDIYTATFDSPDPVNNPNPNNRLLRFDRHGRLVASRSFGTTPLLGLEFNPTDKKVYILAVGDFDGSGSRVLRGRQSGRQR
jgi:DNA-binding beta-propeller fold protein YncE